MMNILIIGGGATGTGIARDLSMRGLDVTLVEKNTLGSGTSGKSHGLLHSGARYAENDYDGAKECIEENEILRNIAGECIRDTNGVFVQLKEDDDKYFEQKRKACEEIGIETEILSDKEIKNIVPDISDNVVKAMKVPDSVIYPSRLVALNAEDAVKHGAEIYTNTKVTNIHTSNNKIESVTLKGNINKEMNPDYIINCTGAWAEKIGDLTKLDISMAPSRGVMVALDYPNIDIAINRCRPPSDGDIIVPHEEQVVVGTTSIPVSKPENYETDEKEIDICITECAKMIPNIKDASIERVWWGARPLYSPDEEGKDRRKISRGFQLLDHDEIENMLSVVGGKLTTYRQMAEETSNYLCNELNIDKECETHIKPLQYKDNVQKINNIVEKYGGYNDTDYNLKK